MTNGSQEPLSLPHRMGLLARLRHLDRLLSEVDAALRAHESSAAFPRLEPDLTAAERECIARHTAALRRELLQFLAQVGIEKPRPEAKARQSILAALVLIEVTLDELEGTGLRGYGEPPEWLTQKLREFTQRVRQSVRQLRAATKSGCV